VSPAARRALAGVVLAQLTARRLERGSPGGTERWRRTNYRGRSVSLTAGPALAIAAAATGPGLAGLVAGAGAGLAGSYDDLVVEPAGAKGFRGHLAALRQGRVTSGAVKIAAISATGVLAAACLRPRRDLLVGGAVIAGSANLVNLLDLRPGRALKVGLVGAVVLGQPGVAGACAALLPSDLGEDRMLGDAGANALGAVLGVALVRRLRSRLARRAVLAALIALTAASERVSFSAVIDRTPVLHRLDRLGRLP
jgi:UDP-N-acetylmuramyl pentapeptide phosphotransferase/UDP-N-acetylglucosamine-1-phosphate transferase